MFLVLSQPGSTVSDKRGKPHSLKIILDILISKLSKIYKISVCQCKWSVWVWNTQKSKSKQNQSAGQEKRETYQTDEFSSVAAGYVNGQVFANNFVKTL